LEGQFAAYTTHQCLVAYASKFLNYIENIRSYSVFTVRSYSVDLAQSLGVEKVSFSDPDLKSPTRLIGTEEEVLALMRGAVSKWSSLAPASRNRKVATLKSFLGWMYQEGLTERELGLQLHGPKVPRRLPHHLSVDEVMALLQSARAKVEEAKDSQKLLMAKREHTLLLLLYGGGLRVSEACGLQWKQIDFDKRVLRILGKGSKERIVAVPPKVISALSELERSHTFVFGREKLDPRKAYDIVREQGRRAGLLKPLHPHALRHSFATHLLSSGANLRTLQELLGHANLQATQRYTHIGVDQLARTMEKFHPLGTPRLKR
jgi:site-specific recombinase XerD